MSLSDSIMSNSDPKSNSCEQLQAGLTEYLDGRLTGRAMQQVDAHLRHCLACAREFESQRELQTVLAALGPVAEPADLPLRIRVAVSQERAHSRRSAFTFLNLAWRNSVGPFILQAGAGLVSAVVLFGVIVLLVTMFAKPETAAAAPDEPLGNATAPRLLYYSNASGDDGSGAIDSAVVVEAYINGSGEVYDYRIVSGPTDAATRSQVANLLLFSRFAPASLYGQPVRGLAVLQFSGVSVRG